MPSGLLPLGTGGADRLLAVGFVWLGMAAGGFRQVESWLAYRWVQTGRGDMRDGEAQK